MSHRKQLSDYSPINSEFPGSIYKRFIQQLTRKNLRGPNYSYCSSHLPREYPQRFCCIASSIVSPSTSLSARQLNLFPTIIRDISTVLFPSFTLCSVLLLYYRSSFSSPCPSCIVLEFYNGSALISPSCLFIRRISILFRYVNINYRRSDASVTTFIDHCIFYDWTSSFPFSRSCERRMAAVSLDNYVTSDHSVGFYAFN